jgi:sporulation protein YlmC with PRC-barrel domain
MKVSKLNGMKVITSDAFTLGEVENSDVETISWHLKYLQVELTKEACEALGFKKPMMGSITVSLPTNVVRHIGDVITVYKSLEELENLKEYKTQ